MTQHNMNRGFFTVTILFIILLSSIPVNAANVPPKPTEEGIWVIDDAGLLVQGQLNYLNEKCNSIYLETGIPVVVLVIESYESQDAPDWWGMEEYARFAFDEYGINDDRNEDKAILIFMSELDRQFRIELGGGYLGEGLDDYVQSIFDNDVRPWLAEDLWFDGLDAAIEGLKPILEEGEIIIPDFDWSDEIWVVDDANILSDDEEVELNLIINEIELETSCPIIILTINSLAEKNASMISFNSYMDKVFDEYEVQDCGIIWGIMAEIDPWSDMYWYQITVLSGEQYNGDWDRFLRDQTWQMEDSLVYGQEYGMNEGSSLFEVTTDITQYSEKAINDDGFKIKEWLEKNSIPILLSSTLLFFGICMFIYSIPKKIKLNRRKDDALEKTAVVNRAIISNLAGNSNIISEWNGIFRNMKDKEIKSFRKLDKILKTEDVNISLEKYERELETIKEIYNLRTNKQDYITIFSMVLSLPIVIMLALSYGASSTWMMEAQQINFENIFMGLFITIFIGGFTIPFLFYPLFKLMDNGRKQLKEEMALILGLPFMTKQSKIYDSDRHHNAHMHEYNWSYRNMILGGSTFRSSSGSTRSETVSYTHLTLPTSDLV